MNLGSFILKNGACRDTDAPTDEKTNSKFERALVSEKNGGAPKRCFPPRRYHLMQGTARVKLAPALFVYVMNLLGKKFIGGLRLVSGGWLF